MDRLAAQGYRGAICGPHGIGKSAMLAALGPRLTAAGFRPIPLFTNRDAGGQLPKDWRASIGLATKRDALLLDGFDTLSPFFRLAVRWVSRRAGAVVVTTHQPGWPKPIAEPVASAQLLAALMDRLSPGSSDLLDADVLFREAGGNLRVALRLAYDRYAHVRASLNAINEDDLNRKRFARSLSR